MKRISLGVVPALLVAAVIAPFVLFWSRLPDPMAIHWGLTGDPNGSMPRLAALALLAGLLVAATVAVWRTLGRSPSEAPSFTAGLYAIGVLLVGVTWASVLANRDAATWVDAGEVTLLHVGLFVVASLAAGAIGWFVADGETAESDPAFAPTLDIEDASDAVWSGRGFGKVTSVIGLGVLAIALVVWGWTAVLLVLIATVAIMFAVVRVTVSKRGAVISMGWWGFPSWTVPLDSIARAEVEIVNPMAYGGWGYRVRPGARAIVVRSGDALRLVRDDRPDLVYTVDDAATGAGLVNAIIAEQSGEGGGDSSRVREEHPDQ